TAPAISCPGNVSFPTYPNACSAQVWLPLAAATDGCSTVSVNASWEFGNGYGPFNSVPVGVHTVTYTAKDACNNTATCQITVTVKDEKKPIALCESSVMAGLQEDGTGLIYAETFDNGSYDNCGIGQLLVNRNGEPFDEFVFFSCDDLNHPVQVTLKVVDVHGLESQCVTNVTVADPVQPGILCPPAANLNCGIAYNNPALTGQPYATDNCSVASVTFTDLVNLSSCGTGTILRTWKATDQSGNFATCLQTITITDNTPISVVFPTDILTYECEPNTDPSATGEPIISGKDCEGLQITHTDYLFYTAEPACFKLIRNWAIINWCVFQPNTPGSPGFWEHTQVIEVRDSVAPVLTCPANFTAGIEGTGCQAFVE
ncbi:MAG: HYR domain-containing protein, partial [Bacteroidota bacterium]